MNKIILLTCLQVLLLLPAMAEKTARQEIFKNPNKAASNYYIHAPKKVKCTPAPQGYTPFYIAHYGRHGARYLGDNAPYHNLISILSKADSLDNLTSKGKKVLKKLRIAYADAHGKAGKLTCLGGQQHEQIAHRLFTNYPEVFATGSVVDAYSTEVDRCIKSMEHFCGELKRLNPTLPLTQTHNKKAYYFVACKGDSIPKSSANENIRHSASKISDNFRHSLNISSALFKDTTFVSKNKKKHYHIAGDLYGIDRDMLSLPELKISFRDILPKEQMYTYWRHSNIHWAYHNGVIAGQTPSYKRMRGWVREMFSRADVAVNHKKIGATLCFGHDSYVYPLAFALGLDGCHPFEGQNYENLEQQIACYKIIPMGCNIQMIFFQKQDSNDILVKFLMQEEEQHIPIKTDVWPFYHYKDVKEYYKQVLDL